jgi:excisionase family DNA binding protein
MQRISAFTEDELAELLTRAARLGASQAIQQSQPKEVMTKKELAEYLRVSVPTIDRKMKEGLPHSYQIGESSPRFYRSKIDAWLNESRI